MIKVRSTAVMELDLEWEGFIPEDVPEDERWVWIKENVDGGEFTEEYGGGCWRWGTDVEVICNFDLKKIISTQAAQKGEAS
jgi:hypothetical protein